MAFSVNYGRNQLTTRRAAAPASTSRILMSALVLFVLFSIYDYSAYGSGYVAAGLHKAQLAFQDQMQRFRVRV